MTALRDADLAGEVYLGAAVVVMDRRMREAAKNVQCGDGLRGFLHALGLLGDMRAQLGENFVFQRDDPVLRAQDGRLEFL